MKIDRFIIEGIANIEHVDLKLESMNALVAPNGYGKSNLLRAIEFGIRFLSADEQERRSMLNSRLLPINIAMIRRDFIFEVSGLMNCNEGELQFIYGCKAEWGGSNADGKIREEWLKVKSPSDQRYRQLINRKGADECLIVPSATARCTKRMDVPSLQLALFVMAGASNMYLNGIAKQIANINIPNIETLDNPESYFSSTDSKGIPMLGSITLSQYLFNLKENDDHSYSILRDGLMQLIPNMCEFSPEVIILADGQSKIYDVRIKEKFNAQSTSIRQLSSGSKRMIFLYTLCVAAKKQNIPVIMLEEPENSVHPRLMESLLATLQRYASDTKIVMTSHSPYLMRYLTPEQIYFGLPKDDGLAHFAKVKPSKLKYLYRYAGDMELTFGEFMFDFMLDIEGNNDKLTTFFE